MTPATSSMVLAACDAYRKWVNRVAYVEAMRRAVEAALRAAPASPSITISKAGHGPDNNCPMCGGLCIHAPRESLGVPQDEPITSSEPDWKSLALKYQEALEYVADPAIAIGEARRRAASVLTAVRGEGKTP